ncbi:MAG: DoxX family protein [Arcobacteraceae bacterium]
MNTDYEESAKFLLRFTVGFLMLFHGIDKLSNGITGMEGMLVNAGIPTFAAYGVYVGEVLAPLMLIVGFRVRIASLLIVVTMLVAIGLTSANDILTLSKHGAWAIELQMFYILTSIVILLQGAGRYSIDEYKK